MKKFSKGFTLIELLVVISIIGLLASVVLVALQSAKKKGQDARIVTNIQQLRNLMETDRAGDSFAASFVVNAGNTTLQTSTKYAAISADIDKNVQPGATGINVYNSTVTGSDAAKGLVIVLTGQVSGSTWTSGPSAYALRGKLSSNKFFCVDSTGRANQSETATAAGVPWTVTCRP